MSDWSVPAVSCGHCVKAVTEAVRALDPQAQVQVDVAGKRVQVQSRLDAAAVRSALAGAGYEAQPIATPAR